MPLWKILGLWDWDPSVLLGCAARLLWSRLASSGRPPRRWLYFVAGDLVLLLSLVSPIDTLGDLYLFSAHMLQHLLLVLVVPPLLLVGIPEQMASGLLRRPAIRRLERALRQPLVAWVVGVGVLSLWHLPVMYDAALENDSIHIVEHLCFLASAVVFWWPVFTPIRKDRLSPLAGALYLMPAASATTLLGLVLAYNSHVIYPFYLQPPDPFGLLPFLRDSWGLDPKSDQEIAGLMMWVPGSFVYLGVIMFQIGRWFNLFEGTSQASD